jgi:hypothetical protein
MSREDFWKQIRNGVVEGFQYTVQKTEELTRLGRLKLDIATQRRKVVKQLSDLGSQVFLIITSEGESDVVNDEKVLASVEGLKEMEAKIKDLEAELQAVQSDLRQKTAESEDMAEDQEVSDEEVTINVDDQMFDEAEVVDVEAPAEQPEAEEAKSEEAAPAAENVEKEKPE